MPKSVQRSGAAHSLIARGWRYTIAVTLAVGVAVGVKELIAQQAGPNTNVLPPYPVGNTFPPSPIGAPDGTTDPETLKAYAQKGDNYLQRQVEGAIAPSSLNPDHLVAAYGDTRNVDIANDTNVPGGGTAQHGWIGYSRSYDRGKTWYGALVSGFPGGTSPADLSSPLRGMTAGADPSLATTPGGHFYLGALFYTPGGESNIVAMHLRDVPDLDGGDSIQPGKITIIDSSPQSPDGQFNDKPTVGADIARGTTNPSVCGPVYVGYSIFVGGNANVPFVTKVGFSRSKQGKCGEAWDNAQYISKNYKHNQGFTMAVDPRNGKIYGVWRHVFQPGGDGFPDSILMAVSNDFGASFSAPVAITGGDFVPFDQTTIKSTTDPQHVAFRTKALPAITVDGNGNVYVAVQEKILGGPPGYYEPRIVIRSLPATAKNVSAPNWTKSLIEAGPFPGGQQVMPSLTFSAGLLRAVWYDFRQPEWWAASSTDPGPWSRPSDCIAPGICYMTGLDRRMETRIAQSAVSASGALAFGPSKPVSNYNTYLLGGLPVANRPNLPLWDAGTVAFTSDYMWVVAATQFVRTPEGPNAFRWATKPEDVEALSSLTVWTDTRDVVAPIGPSGQPELSVANILGFQNYGPPGTGALSCINPGARNQNIYFSEVNAGVIGGSPATSRQLVDENSMPFERAFPFYVQNGTFTTRFLRLTFRPDSNTTVVAGSFVQGTAQTTPQSPLPHVDVTALPFSTVSNTIYAYCPSCTGSNAFGPFSIKVEEIDGLGGAVKSGGLTTLIRFNSDPTAPFVTNTGLGSTETHEVSFTLADWANADWANADWANADWANADWANADWANADWANADWANADWANADWANADWANTSPVGDLVSTASNVGNNASSYSVFVNIDPALANYLKGNGYKAALIISRSYNKAASFANSNCAITPIPLDQVISVVPLDLDNPQSTFIDSATFVAAPAAATSSSATLAASSSSSATLADGSSSGTAEIQPDRTFIVLRVLGPRTNGAPAPPLTEEQQQQISDLGGDVVTVVPQAGDTEAGKQTATVTLSNLSQTYNGTPLSPTVTTNPAGLNVVLMGAPQTDVGSYVVTATIDDPIYQGTQTGIFVIHPAPVTATAGSGSATYNGAQYAPPACQVTGAYTGDLTCVNSPAVVGPDAGATVITPVVSGTGLSNFDITLVNGSFTIAQAPSTTTFGPAPAATYPGGNFTVSASNNSGGAITYAKVSGPCTLVDASAGTFSPTGVGDCVVQADSASTLNYLASSAQQTVTINAAVTETPVLWVGNDTQSPVERFMRDGTSIGHWGATGATGSALDGAGHAYTVVPGCSDSVITKYDATQTPVGTTIHFTSGLDNGNGCPSWIEDMTYGGDNTLWVSGFNGIVYHINSTGAILSSFDTGFTFTGIATDGSSLYTTTGFSTAVPGVIHKRDVNGNILASLETGISGSDGVGGLGYDATDGTLWVGSFGKVTHVSLTGAVLSYFTTVSPAFHDGLEVGVPGVTLEGPPVNLWVGNDIVGPVLRFARDGTSIGTWGANGATGSALDGAGHVYTVVPGCSDSVITKYDAAQTPVGTIHFTSGLDNENGCPSWIEDMTYGGDNTLWVSGFNGIVYHINSTGAILSSFDTGFTFTGIATDGSSLYTTTGFSTAVPGVIHKRDVNGTIQASLATGITTGIGGLGFDVSDDTLWVGTVGKVYHISLTGAVLGYFATGSERFHDGLEAGTPP